MQPAVLSNADQKPVPSREYHSIQYLRAAAAISIVVYHTGRILARLGYAGGWPEGLQAGVDIFFVISGFVMWHSTWGRTIGPVKFFVRRLTRIVPLYWIFTTVMVAMLVLMPKAVQTGKFVLLHAVASYFFVPMHHPVTGDIWPVLIPGWTLNMEMFFYLLFGLALLLPTKARIGAVWACLLGFIALRHFVHPHGVLVEFYGYSIVLDFGFGLLLGWLADSGWKPKLWLAVLLLIAGAMGFWMLPFAPPRVMNTGLPALGVVAGLVAAELAGMMRRFTILHLLGDASYSIYLSHTIVLSALGQFAKKAHLSAATAPGTILCAMLLIGASLVVGVLVYRWVERPLIDLLTPGRRRTA